MENTCSRSPKISVIVPVYHVEEYLRRCLDSILKQSFEDFELILVNDGGNAAETAICEEYAQTDSRIIYLRQENAGLSAARNTGLDICRGEWIMFVDSDDWVHPDFCSKALASVEGTDALMGIFDLVYTQGDGTTGTVHKSMLPEGKHDSLTVLKARLSGAIAGYAWNKIYHRSIWDTLRFPVGECWEDDAVIHITIDLSPVIVIIHDVLYYKPIRGSSISSAAYASAEDTKWLYIQRRKRYDYLKEKHPELLGDVQTNMAMTAWFYGAYRLHFAPDKAEYESARAWARQEKLALRNVKPHIRLAYRFFLYSTPLFWATSLIWAQNRRKKVLKFSRG